MSVAYAETVIICSRAFRLPVTLVFASALGVAAAAATLNGLPAPLPLFPRTNWWNVDISQAPVDPSSAGFISFIGTTRRLHPDFGGEVSPGSGEITRGWQPTGPHPPSNLRILSE